MNISIIAVEAEAEVEAAAGTSKEFLLAGEASAEYVPRLAPREHCSSPKITSSYWIHGDKPYIIVLEVGAAVVEEDAARELEGEEQRMADFVADVGGGEVAAESIHVVVDGDLGHPLVLAHALAIVGV
jgi:hypothetical protein